MAVVKLLNNWIAARKWAQSHYLLTPTARNPKCLWTVDQYAIQALSCTECAGFFFGANIDLMHAEEANKLRLSLEVSGLYSWPSFLMASTHSREACVLMQGFSICIALFT